MKAWQDEDECWHCCERGFWFELWWNLMGYQDCNLCRGLGIIVSMDDRNKRKLCTDCKGSGWARWGEFLWW